MSRALSPAELRSHGRAVKNTEAAKSLQAALRDAMDPQPGQTGLRHPQAPARLNQTGADDSGPPRDRIAEALSHPCHRSASTAWHAAFAPFRPAFTRLATPSRTSASVDASQPSSADCYPSAPVSVENDSVGLVPPGKPL